MNGFRLYSMLATCLVATASLAQHPAAKPPPEPPSGKIGFVDNERVLRDARLPRQQRQRLEEKFARAMKELEALPESQAERRRGALEEDLAIEREDMLRQYVDRTNRIIRRIAMEENMDIVFLEAAYYSQRIDITDKVIKTLDAEP